MIVLRLKRWLWLPALLAAIFFAPSTMWGQQPPAPLERLAVDIWLDFDRPQALLLFTGDIAANVPRPATIVLPAPATAEINAVAEMDSRNDLFDIPYQIVGEQAIFEIGENGVGFRLEYYIPYQSDGNQRTFSMVWEAPSDVAQFAYRAQQPPAASPLRIDPAPVSTTQESFGLDYYNLPAISLATGETASISIAYEATGVELTSDSLFAANSSSPLIEEPVEEGRNWELIIAGILTAAIGAAGVWLWLNRRQPERVLKPKRAPTAAKKRARFCRHCGNGVSAGDKYCRQCGKPIT